VIVDTEVNKPANSGGKKTITISFPFLSLFLTLPLLLLPSLFKMIPTFDVDALFPYSSSTTNYFFDSTARTSSNLFDHLEPAKGEGSIVLGGEVYCPQYHFVKAYERYEAPGSPTAPPLEPILKMRRQLSTTTTCSSGSSSRTLCDQCDSVSFIRTYSRLMRWADSRGSI